MKKWIAFGLGLALSASLASSLYAQAPPAPPPQAAAGLGIIKGLVDMAKAAKDAFCASCIGKLLTASMKPMGAFLPCAPERCPAVPAAELAAGGARGAAAQIMKDMAACKERRLAVRYLGTVDCHYWPEATDGLIAALRADRCECVRLEAAWALGRGCCCNPRTIDALLTTVNSKGNGIAADTSPEETSERVKAAAAMALAHCLSCYVEVTPAAAGVKPEPPVKTSLPPKEKALASSSDPFTEYYKRVDSVPMPQLVERARQTLIKMKSSVPLGAVAHGSNGGHSVLEIVAKAMAPQGPQPSEDLKISEASQDVILRPEAMQGDTRISQVSYQQPATGISQVSYQQPATGSSQVSYQQPASKTAPAAKLEEGGPVRTHVQMLALLRSSLYAERRVWAAENMSNFDWRISPEIVEGLVNSARKDTVATVRAACIRCLLRMNANTAPVLSTLQVLRADTNPGVRAEAEKALTQFSAARLRASARPVTKPSSLTFAAGK